MNQDQQPLESSQVHFLSKLAPGVHGIALIDKPTGLTSHDVVNRVRHLTGEKRVGHAGTLDPLASGLLIILIGREFTKLQDFFLHQPKTYEVVAGLGYTTDTYDKDGHVVHRAPWSETEKIRLEKLESVLSKFRGEHMQRVPAFSAVKQAGQKLYEKARRGQVSEEDLPMRVVTISQLDLTHFHLDRIEKRSEFHLTVSCSSGTYIRSLVHDIGQTLGVCATVTALRRVSVGEWQVSDAQLLPDTRDVR
jgi:tRNA pseudouridine55 synthase